MPRRKPGGQPGNTNALKHGFYSRRFRKLEHDDLDAINDDLDNEITLLRVYMRRLLDKAEEEEETIEDLKENLELLGLTSTRIAALLRTRALLTGNQDETAHNAIQKALSEVITELQLAQ